MTLIENHPVRSSIFRLRHSLPWVFYCDVVSVAAAVVVVVVVVEPVYFAAVIVIVTFEHQVLVAVVATATS